MTSPGRRSGGSGADLARRHRGGGPARRTEDATSVACASSRRRPRRADVDGSSPEGLVAHRARARDRLDRDLRLRLRDLDGLRVADRLAPGPAGPAASCRRAPSSGLDNYEAIFSTARFWTNDIFNNAVFTLVFVTGCLLLGLLLAILIDQHIRGESIFRGIFLLPMAISFIVTGHDLGLDPQPDRRAQRAHRGHGHRRRARRRSSRPACSSRSGRSSTTCASTSCGPASRPTRARSSAPSPSPPIWQMSGFVMALYLAGLRGVSDELREAARMDGASETRIYRHIVLPLLRPITVSAIVLLGYISLKMFDLVFVLTRGGPALASDLPSIFMFETTFRGQLFAQGAAVATVMFLVSAVLIVPYVRAQLRSEPGMSAHRAAGPGRGSAGRAARREPSYGLYSCSSSRAALPHAPLRRRGGQPEVVHRGQLVEHLDPARVSPASDAFTDSLTPPLANSGGIASGLVNSLTMTIPAVIVSALWGSVTGYALSMWRFRGSELALRARPLRPLHPLSGDPHPAADDPPGAASCTARWPGSRSCTSSSACPSRCSSSATSTRPSPTS